MAGRDACRSNELQLQNFSLNFIPKSKPILSARRILSRSPMAHDTIASLNKLSFTDYVDFSNCQNKLELFFRSKNDSNYLDVKPKIFKKGENKEFQLVQKLTMGKQISTSLCD